MDNVAKLASSIIHMVEGLKLKAYQDTGGVWTIGFGHTKNVKKGDVITVEQANELFEQDQQPLLKAVEGLPTFKAAALVSFGFNCGLGALKRVVSGDIVVRDGGFFTKQGREYGIRDKAGTVLPGLVARRRLEATIVEVSDAS